MTEIVEMNRHELNVAVGKIFRAFPSASRQGVRAETYVEALSRLPLSYVQEACDMAMRGKLGDGSTIPSAAKIAQLAETLRWRKEGGRKPEPEDPYHYHSTEERARIVLGFRQLLRDIRHGKLIDPDTATAQVFTLRGPNE